MPPSFLNRLQSHLSKFIVNVSHNSAKSQQNRLVPAQLVGYAALHTHRLRIKYLSSFSSFNMNLFFDIFSPDKDTTNFKNHPSNLYTTTIYDTLQYLATFFVVIFLFSGLG